MSFNHVEQRKAPKEKKRFKHKIDFSKIKPYKREDLPVWILNCDEALGSLGLPVLIFA